MRKASEMPARRFAWGLPLAFLLALVVVLSGCGPSSPGAASDSATASDVPASSAVQTGAAVEAAPDEIARGDDPAPVSTDPAPREDLPSASDPAPSSSALANGNAPTGETPAADDAKSAKTGGTPDKPKGKDGGKTQPGRDDAKAGKGGAEKDSKKPDWDEASDAGVGTKPVAGPSPSPAPSPTPDVDSGANPAPEPAKPVEETVAVSIAIDCKTLYAAHPDLAALVSKDGVICAKKDLTVKKGANVYDVLSASGVSFVGKAYISSVNGLSEGDGGGRSGWMYSVNGVFPGKGVLAYTVENGDVVAFRYTLNGGSDVK